MSCSFKFWLSVSWPLLKRLFLVWLFVFPKPFFFDCYPLNHTCPVNCRVEMLYLLQVGVQRTSRGSIREIIASFSRWHNHNHNSPVMSSLDRIRVFPAVWPLKDEFWMTALKCFALVSSNRSGDLSATRQTLHLQSALMDRLMQKRCTLPRGCSSFAASTLFWSCNLMFHSYSWKIVPTNHMIRF